MQNSLILLSGMPRSGTSWIGKIFDSHPGTLYRHEPDSGSALKSLPLVLSRNETEKHREAIKTFAEQLPRMNTSRAAGSLPSFPKHYHSTAYYYFHNFMTLAAKFTEPFVKNPRILDVIDYDKIQNLHVIWKSIESLGRLGLIRRALPECRNIVILRHPCGYVASVLAGQALDRFSSATPSYDDFPVFEKLLAVSQHRGRNPSIQQLRSMSPEERLTWRWVLFNEIALAETAGCKFSMPLVYEDLCSHPLAKAQELFRFANLSWHPQVESFIRASTTHKSTRYYSVFKDPKDSSTKWQDQINATTIGRILEILANSDLHQFYPSGVESVHPISRPSPNDLALSM